MKISILVDIIDFDRLRQNVHFFALVFFTRGVQKWIKLALDI